VRIVLHGGEPLLHGLDGLESISDYARRAVPAACGVTVGIQTNGMLLTEATVARLRDARISVGVSLDGTEVDHDRHRRTRSGHGTHAAVRRGLDQLRRPENQAIYAGLLCTVMPAADPIRCYEELAALEPPTIDLLLPHATWQHPPPAAGAGPTPYADWLIVVFDHWYERAGAPAVRIFDDILTLLLGGQSGSEQVGLSPAAMLVVESDGAIEQVDALKTAYDGACATGRDVIHDDFDTVLEDPGVLARQIGPEALCATCLACPIHAVCGGGHYVHRYRPGVGFYGPSVYCADLRRLIDHVAARVRSGLDARIDEVG
jgi:uncharacterized protein